MDWALAGTRISFSVPIVFLNFKSSFSLILHCGSVIATLGILAFDTY